MKFIINISSVLIFAISASLFSCNETTNGKEKPEPAGDEKSDSIAVLQPLIITDTVPNDSDDPAIWINPSDPSKSLVLGTDKDPNGGLYVFSLDGKMDSARSVRGLKRPNNVDIEYGLMLQGKKTDIAVTTERLTHKLRIYSLPEMIAIDNGGIEVYRGERAAGFRDLMGIALYKNQKGETFAIVGRKTGPTDSNYLWQYQLKDNGKGQVKATLVRKFGKYSGFKEIEAIAVDDELGYVYYSDEGRGIRKYYADPAKGNDELAFFAQQKVKEDHEGISIYKTGDSTGFILLSDQQANQFQIFPRNGIPGHPQEHPLLKIVKVAANESDGSETTAIALNGNFPRGIFVAMSDNKTFHFYKPEDILGDLIK